MSFDPTPVYGLVEDVPAGSVASYGMIATLLPGITARMVGRALSQLSDGNSVPWHRIVNASGNIASRASASEQRRRLKKEGVALKPNGSVVMRQYRWEGPSPLWIEINGADVEEVMEIVASWKR